MEKEQKIEKKYELVTIVDAKYTNEEKQEIYKVLADAVKKSGGKVINSQVWLEKHKLTFEINKVKEGDSELFVSEVYVNF